ncbi:hypothetical protein CC86DRAFT_462750 [Ophiobolus disseminans]|uniref:ZZ-type domain-containing protein n=1 Tax=Ophiobolus disseminans TaxID=1469910 RepID=A0A6A7AGY7_9PLEO|nr:hypothetical protein CC86DRAFT_462750 [Ophiobolus disseminans]
MDHVGLAASVITIARLIWVALSRTTTIISYFLFEATRDLELLQEDIKRFRSLLVDIKCREVISSNARVHDVDIAFQKIVHQVDQVSEGKIFCFHSEYIVPVGLCLIVYHRKLDGLKNCLRTLKDDLQTAASAESLAESSGSTIKVGLVHQNYVNARHVNSNAVRARLGGSSGTTTYQTRSVFGTAAFANTSLTRPSRSVRKVRSSPPIGILESSQTFYPESYTSHSQVPDVVVFGRHEEISTNQSSVNLYKILYFRDPRNWTILNVSLEIPRSSNLWRFIRLSQHENPRFNAVTASCIPLSLLKLILLKLKSLGPVQEASHVHLRLSLNDQRNLTVAKVTAPFEYDSCIDQIERTEQKVTNAMYHMGCRMIHEKQVARLACIDLPDRFLVSIDGRNVEEVMSLRRPPDLDFCNRIRLLHRLRDKPGFPRLVGVTVDTITSRIKSYLVAWPDTACQLLFHRASDTSIPCSWQMVEHWSRQLLQRTGEVHGVGDVVGTLRFLRPPILVDALDQVHLWQFQTTLDVAPNASTFYPPEFRHFAQSVKQCDIKIEGCLTPAYDVYQCGQILWMLAKGWASNSKSALEIREDFNKTPESNDAGLWFGPHPLPRLPELVPSWFQEVVDACCADLPERWSCQDVLTKFPHSGNDTETKMCGDVKHQPQDECNIQACRMNRHGCCDLCSRQYTLAVYQCHLCSGDDYQLCSICFNQGKHCEDSEHLLVEIQFGGSFPIAVQYFSSPDACGKRKIFTV